MVSSSNAANVNNNGNANNNTVNNANYVAAINLRLLTYKCFECLENKEGQTFHKIKKVVNRQSDAA